MAQAYVNYSSTDRTIIHSPVKGGHKKNCEACASNKNRWTYRWKRFKSYKAALPWAKKHAKSHKTKVHRCKLSPCVKGRKEEGVR